MVTRPCIECGTPTGSNRRVPVAPGKRIAAPLCLACGIGRAVANIQSQAAAGQKRLARDVRLAKRQARELSKGVRNG